MKTNDAHLDQKINFDFLDDLAGNEPQVLKSLLQMIQKHLHSYPDVIISAFKDGDNQRVAEQAHKFKSSVGYLRLQTFDQTLEALESIRTKTITQDAIQCHLDQLERIVAQVAKQVAQKIDSIAD